MTLDKFGKHIDAVKTNKKYTEKIEKLIYEYVNSTIKKLYGYLDVIVVGQKVANQQQYYILRNHDTKYTITVDGSEILKIILVPQNLQVEINGKLYDKKSLLRIKLKKGDVIKVPVVSKVDKCYANIFVKYPILLEE